MTFSEASFVLLLIYLLLGEKPNEKKCKIKPLSIMSQNEETLKILQ